MDRTDKMKRVYLDDERTPIEASNWEVCRNYDEFVSKVLEIGLENIDLMSLDHDLGDTAKEEYFGNVTQRNILDYDNIKEKTGLDCAKWLIEYSMDNNIKLPLILVHSANPIGASNIMGYINNYLNYKGFAETCIKNIIPFTC